MAPATGADANGVQNFPALTIVESNGLTVHIAGTLNSTPNRSFALDIFASTACDPTGYGEGRAYLGAIAVTTNGAGNAVFDATLPAAAPVGWQATATATDSNGSTSEFSACVSIAAGGLAGDFNGDGHVDNTDL